MAPGITARRAPVVRIIAVFLALTALMAGPPAAAADDTTDPWVYEAYLSLFLPTTVSGTTTFPPGSSAPPDESDVRVSDGLVNVESAFVGGFSARRGRWGVYTYLIYVDLVGTRTGPGVIEIAGHPLDIQTTATARLGIRDTYALLAGTYRLVADPERSLDLLVGARLFDQHRSLDWQLSGNVAAIPPDMQSGGRSVSASGADAIVGLNGRFGPTGNGWFLPYYADVGTGRSTLTWQLNGGIGYGWRRSEVALGWRYMHYDTPHQNIESIGLNGPVLVILFRW